MQVVIYKNNDGVALVFPTNFAISNFGIEYIAKKSVPNGKPYKIININELPLDGTLNELGQPNIDKSFRDAWTIEESLLNDGIGEAE